MSKEIARITAISKGVAAPAFSGSEFDDLAFAAAAALQMLADAIKRGAVDHDQVVTKLQDARVHEALADVLDAASDATMDDLDDPFEFDGSLRADNLGGAAIDIRKAFKWL